MEMGFPLILVRKRGFQPHPDKFMLQLGKIPGSPAEKKPF